MITYIKKSIPGFYCEREDALDPALFSDLGTTYEDFLKGDWVELSEEQVKFHVENPDATIRQVMEMKLPEPPVRTLADAVGEALSRIDAYDTSDAVDGFEIVGVPGKYWFGREERNTYKSSVDAAKLLGEQSISFYVGDYPLSVSVEKAEYLLAMLQNYADKCYMVTMGHKLAVQALEEIEAVDRYDYTVGYPQSPKFDLSEPQGDNDVESKEEGGEG